MLLDHLDAAQVLLDHVARSRVYSFDGIDCPIARLSKLLVTHIPWRWFAHIYIEQLHDRNEALREKLAPTDLFDRL